MPKPTWAKSVRKMSAKSITRPPPRGADAQDRQGHQDRVGVVLLDRLLQGRARRRGEVDVLADELEIVADPAEREHPLVAEIERLAGVGRPAGDHHRRQDRLLELLRLDLGVKVLVLLMERDETLVGLRTLDQRLKSWSFLCSFARPMDRTRDRISIGIGPSSAGSCAVSPAAPATTINPQSAMKRSRLPIASSPHLSVVRITVTQMVSKPVSCPSFISCPPSDWIFRALFRHVNSTIRIRELHRKSDSSQPRVIGSADVPLEFLRDSSPAALSLALLISPVRAQRREGLAKIGPETYILTGRRRNTAADNGRWTTNN